MKKILPPIIILLILFIKSYIDLYGIESLNINTSIKNSIWNNDEQIITISKEKKDITIKVTNNNNYNVRYTIYLLKTDITNYNELYNIKYSINNITNNLENIKNNNYIIYSGIIKSRKTKKYILNTWLDSNTEVYLKLKGEMIKENIKFSAYLKSKVNKNNKYYMDLDESKEMYKVGSNYKYIGDNPNNYIYYNCTSNNLLKCNLYRIMGMSKIENEYRIRIMKDNKEIYLNNNHILVSGDGSFETPYLIN